MAKLETIDNVNIKKLRNLVEELTLRDEMVFKEHQLFENIIKLVLDGVWIFNEFNVTTYINNKMALILGYTTEEVMGRSMFDFMDEEGKILAENNLERRKAGISETHYFKWVKKNGETVLTQMSTSPMIGPKKRYLGCITYIKEISDKEIANFYKQMFFDLSLDVLLILDFNGLIKDANIAYFKLVANDRDDVLGKHFTHFMTESEKIISNDAFKELLDSGDLMKFKNKIINNKGEEVEISWRAKTSPQNGLIFANGRIILK